MYGFIIGLVLGWGVAYLRNLSVKIYISIIRRRVEGMLIETFGYFPDGQSVASDMMD